LVLLNIADGVLTHFLVELGLGRESNPFLLGLVGHPSFMAIKVVGAVVCALILWDVYRRHPRLGFLSTLFIVTSYTGIVIWNSSLFLG